MTSRNSTKPLKLPIDITQPKMQSFSPELDNSCNNSNCNKWYCESRKNNNILNVSPDNSFKDTKFENYLDNTPLLFDGLFKI